MKSHADLEYPRRSAGRAIPRSARFPGPAKGRTSRRARDVCASYDRPRDGAEPPADANTVGRLGQRTGRARVLPRARSQSRSTVCSGPPPRSPRFPSTPPSVTGAMITSAGKLTQNQAAGVGELIENRHAAHSEADDRAERRRDCESDRHAGERQRQTKPSAPEPASRTMSEQDCAALAKAVTGEVRGGDPAATAAPIDASRAPDALL